ncbi:unnamed protein product [Tetraodon nigroviridis]|uniref:(spotted green pufferfish) hypothetical protein n=1 Tax=Tetraodon nigroviridis TaxID=99883 RepID=Q4RRQ7_TETNG|nr:unnamed protein product [Tetraodon nigroviridis]
MIQIHFYPVEEPHPPTAIAAIRLFSSHSGILLKRHLLGNGGLWKSTLQYKQAATQPSTPNCERPLPWGCIEWRWPADAKEGERGEAEEDGVSQRRPIYDVLR